MSVNDLDHAIFDEAHDIYDGRKPWWQARRIWGLLIMAGAWAYNLAAARYGWAAATYDLGLLSTSLDGLIAVVGFVVTWWGSVKASQPISMHSN